MFLKSLVVLVAAAILAPTIGVAMFFMVGSYDSGEPTAISATPSLKAEQTTGSGQAEISERFLPEEPWRASAATVPQERKPETAAAQWSTEPGTWQTTVSCPGGAHLAEEGPCPSLGNGKAPKTKKHSLPDVTPAAERFASGKTDINMHPPSRPLPERMTVGRPNIRDASPMRTDRDAAWPAAVVIIKSRPVSEPEATMADIVLKPPIFAERNSLGGPKPIFSSDLAKLAIAHPAAVGKKATDTRQIVRRTVRSRTRRAKNVRANRRRTSSKSWKDKVWYVPN